ncbi:type 2 lanthipeptide synthetase LanM family protein [Priestia endophytica]|uniref:type 2 lanthipeptide synthetase LanM family protein n=1 Tax=Priestia endophytica TaxID=135735 RepID=UPI00178C1A15|nr:type 2 lanthipeptide synthetase LanM family protein [Priestia endophytica]
MSNSYAYNALSILERKKFYSRCIESNNINQAITFWKKINNLKDDKEFFELLRENYDLKEDNFKDILSWNEDRTLDINSDWKLFIDSYINVKTSEKYTEYYSHLKEYPFFNFFKPFLSGFLENYVLNNIMVSNVVIKDIISQVIEILFKISHKTLILEINVMRQEEMLTGNSSEERYKHFCALLEEDWYKEQLINEYGVLFRLLATSVINLGRFLEDLLQRLKTDKYEIEQQLLNKKSFDLVTAIKFGTGDSHNEGKTVSIIELDNDQKLVYKPRSLGIDHQFNEFIKFYNEISNLEENNLKVVNVIDKELYGWSQYIDYIECKNANEVSRFYHRLGQNLAILHIFNATDFHYENIIAHGEHPVLIDLESLFHHAVIPDHQKTKNKVVNKGLEVIRNSIVSTGLIPSTVTNERIEGNRFDLSGISNVKDQITPFKGKFIKNFKTDKIKIEKEHFVIEAGLNVPKIKGNFTSITDYLSDIEKGFKQAYMIILDNKEKVINKFKDFSGVQIRKIFRDTMKYAKLLDLSYHPDFLRNQIDREMLLNRLWFEVKNEGSVSKIASFEVMDMLRGDIPYFYSQPEELHIYNSKRNKIENFYLKSGLELSIEKIKNMSIEDCQYQKELITSNISVVYDNKDVNLLKFNNELTNGIDRVEQIANILIDKAIKHQEGDTLEYCWTSMILQGSNETKWNYSVTGPGLYDGNTGIALFFAYLYKITNNAKYKEAAYSSINPVRELNPELTKKKDVGVGAFLGLGGILYTLHHMARVFKDENLLKECLSYCEKLPEFIVNDRMYDVISGSSGLLQVLINLYEDTNKEWILEIAKSIAKHLKDQKIEEYNGVYWKAINSNTSYIGFSHGNAGIAAALSRLYMYYPNSDIKELIEESIKYENQFYNNSKKNWFSEDMNDFPIAWCHGSPGILLGRLIMMNSGIDDVKIKEEIQSIIHDILLNHELKNHSLCHGYLGNLDIILKAKEWFPEYFHNEEINVLFSGIYNSIINENNYSADVNSVGLMNGLASIGYGLLRVLEPHRVPSILALDNLKE